MSVVASARSQTTGWLEADESGYADLVEAVRWRSG
jgi:hypothetical protein